MNWRAVNVVRDYQPRYARRTILTIKNVYNVKHTNTKLNLFPAKYYKNNFYD